MATKVISPRIKYALYIILMLHMLVLLLVPTVTAQTYKQNDCVEIKTILNNTAWANLSSVSYPNSTMLYLNKAMTKQGLSFNYSFCSTSALGTYTYDFYNDLGNIYTDNFIITSNGYPTEDNSYAIILGLSIIIIILLSISFVWTDAHWMIKLMFIMFALYMGTILTNVVSELAESQLSLTSIMSSLAIVKIIMIILVWIIIVYLLIIVTVAVFKMLANARHLKMTGRTLDE